MLAAVYDCIKQLGMLSANWAHEDQVRVARDKAARDDRRPEIDAALAASSLARAMLWLLRLAQSSG